jgi:hypothetical protein
LDCLFITFVKQTIPPFTKIVRWMIFLHQLVSHIFSNRTVTEGGCWSPRSAVVVSVKHTPLTITRLIFVTDLSRIYIRISPKYPPSIGKRKMEVDTNLITKTKLHCGGLDTSTNRFIFRHIISIGTTHNRSHRFGEKFISKWVVS